MPLRERGQVDARDFLNQMEDKYPGIKLTTLHTFDKIGPGVRELAEEGGVAHSEMPEDAASLARTGCARRASCGGLRLRSRNERDSRVSFGSVSLKKSGDSCKKGLLGLSIWSLLSNLQYDHFLAESILLFSPQAQRRRSLVGLQVPLAAPCRQR